jgi:hypothetical protein
MARIECYVDENIKDVLKEKASDQGFPLSKYVSKILGEFVTKGDEEDFNHMKTHTLLAHIFSCVYDESFHKKNADTVRSRLCFLTPLPSHEVDSQA